MTVVLSYQPFQSGTLMGAMVRTDKFMAWFTAGL